MLFVAIATGATIGALFIALWPTTTISYERPAVDELTHSQRVWQHALEWCESRGVVTAINPNDRDNTPSYYSFQWKPSTFRYFGEKYGVLAKGATDAENRERMKNYDTQLKILDQMIFHHDEINWGQQFPDCTKRLGYPPKK